MNLVFKGKKVASKQKLRGGYYTPPKLANFLSQWAIRDNTNSILEPSCGDGNFILSILDKGPLNNLTAVEIDSNEIEKAKIRANHLQNSHINWINNDFFRSFDELKKQGFDCILGNPPFIRFQHFDDESRDIAFEHLRNANYKPTKLANCWAAFVQLSIETLNTNGRLAMVIPAEILQVKYASQLRERITQCFEHIIIVTFKKLVFKDIQQEVVLLLLEGKREFLGEESDVHTVEIEDEHQLDVTVFNKIVSHKKAKHARQGLKWTSLFLSEEEFKVIDQVQRTKSLTHLGDFASIDVGIVTGRNSFFVLTEEIRNNFDLSKFTVPLVGKTSALTSLSFSHKNFNDFKLQQPAYLLDLKGVDEKSFNDGLKQYISIGEEQEVHKGYKCRIRKRWYDVPSTHLSDGFLFRQIHKFPLLVSNDAKARCTDTIHRVRLIDSNISIQNLSATFINSLTFAWSEVCGRSYGGGVLELEPNEAEELPLPYFDDVELDVDFINNCIQNGEIESALDYVDEKILVNKLGISREKINLLRKAWQRLRDRRIKRK